METFTTIVNEFLIEVNNILWGWPMIILLVGTHLFLTLRLRFPQRYVGKAIRLSLQHDKEASGDVSQFSALATSLAATIGTGNIIGVATAVTSGGPGAVFWCWITGVLGIATKYAEALLAVKYRVQGDNGKMKGGPMYAIERGMRCKWLAVLFALFAFLASFGIGGMVQANAIAQTVSDTFGGTPLLTGSAIALLLACVIFFGVKGIGRVCEGLVPFMAVFYVSGCLILLGINHSYILPALQTILREAFSTEAIEGGALGSVIMLAMRFGVARGLFSNEAGMGSAPIVAAAARTKNPVRQALVSSSSVFWDTVVICAITGLVLVSTLLAPNGITLTSIGHLEVNGVATSAGELTKCAFDQLPFHLAGFSIGRIVLSIAICTFAFSTILGWSYYGEKALEYLAGRFGRAARYCYRILIICASFLGAGYALDLVWNFGDAANALMAIPNLICLLALSSVLVRETRHYLWEDRLDEEA